MESDDGDIEDEQAGEPSTPPSHQELLELTGENELDQIRELVLRKAGLGEIGSLFKPLCALEVLSLSNNLLRSLDGCATLTGLLVLNINFNRIASLEPLAHCHALTKLYASTNKVGVAAPLAACSDLRVLSLYHNRIASLDAAIETLRQLPVLEELDLAANPVSCPPCVGHPGCATSDTDGRPSQHCVAFPHGGPWSRHPHASSLTATLALPGFHVSLLCPPCAGSPRFTLSPPADRRASAQLPRRRPHQ